MPNQPTASGKLRSLADRATKAKERYLKTNVVAHIEEALALWQRLLSHPAFAQAPLDFKRRVWNNAGLSHWYCYGAQGRIEDLDKALELWNEALKSATSISTKAGYLNNLGNGLSARYARTGDLADLTKALECYQQAVDLTPAKAMYLNNLGNGLRDRYARTGDLADLTKALECYQQAVELTPANSPDKAMYLNNLGNGLRARYARTGDLADLTKALECSQQAVALTPATSPAKAGYLNNLGTGLRDRYESTGDFAGLTKALECWQQAVDLTPANSTDKAGYLNNLGNGLRDRYESTGEFADLTKALECWQQAVELTPANSPDKAMYLNNLGNGLRDRYARTGDLADLAQAQACFEKALQSSSFDTFPQEYRRAAFNLGQLHYQAGQIAEAHAALVKAHQAVENLRTGTQSEAVRRKTSVDNVQLSRLLVACCLKLAEFSQGFEYAAAGKGRAFVDRLTNTSKDFKTILSRNSALEQAAQPYLILRQKTDDLSAQILWEETEAAKKALAIETKRKELEQLQKELSDQMRGLETKRKDLEQLQGVLSTQWEALSQAYPLLTSTDSAPTLDLPKAQTLAGALGATLVEYYQHAEGWGAFVITPTTFHYIPLEKLTEERLEKMQGWLERVSECCTQSMEGPLYHWYEAIFAPLAPHIIPPTQPVILAPYGILQRLPLAVARNKAQKKYLAEEYTLAFAPSLSALWVVYQQAKQDEQKDKGPQPQIASHILTVAYPGADPADPYYLDNVIPEAEAIADLFPHAEVKKLHEAAAKTSEVLAEAKGQTLVHIGCHGGFNPSNPEASGLILADGPLTVRDIVRDLRLEETQLVTLAACQSGQSSANLANEGTGLIQAMLTAGTPVVIASLWSVSDDTTKVLFGEFYQQLHTGQPPAIALREAAQKVRAVQEHPFYWAAFQANGLALTPQEEALRLPFQKPGEGTFVTTKVNARTKQGGQPLDATVEQQKIVDDARWRLEQLEEDDEEEVVKLLKERGEGKLLLEQFDSLVAESEKVSDYSSLFQLASNIHKMVEEISVLRERLLPSNMNISAVRKVREYNLKVIVETKKEAPKANYVAERKPEIENDLNARRARFKALLEGEGK